MKKIRKILLILVTIILLLTIIIYTKALSFSASTQADWNLGTFINTTANSSGSLLLMLDNRSQIGEQPSFDTTGLVAVWHFNNESNRGENDTAGMFLVRTLVRRQSGMS